MSTQGHRLGTKDKLLGRKGLGGWAVYLEEEEISPEVGEKLLWLAALYHAYLHSRL